MQSRAASGIVNQKLNYPSSPRIGRIRQLQSQGLSYFQLIANHLQHTTLRTYGFSQAANATSVKDQFAQ